MLARSMTVAARKRFAFDAIQSVTNFFNCVGQLSTTVMGTCAAC
jgi:hypothetical protein